MAAKRQRAFSTPPQYLVSDFLRHIKATGEPHTWQYLADGKPPEGDIHVLFHGFQISERHVSEKGYAPCPICRPNYPIYAKGHLLWSPISGGLYAVGHCCGHNYFADGIFQDGLNANRQRNQRNSDEEFLELNWFMPAAYLVFAQRHSSKARALDQLNRTVRAGISGSMCTEIIRDVGDTGYLRVPVDLDRDNLGKGSLSGTFEQFGNQPLRGVQFLKGGRSRKLAEARLQAVQRSLEMVDWPDQNSALEWLAVKPQEDLAHIAGALRQADRDYPTVVAEFSAAREFLQSSNLALLSAWAKRRYPFPRAISVSWTSEAMLTVWRGTGHKRIIVQPSLLEEPSPVPMLRRPL